MDPGPSERPPVTARAAYLSLLRGELDRLGVPLVTVAPDAPTAEPGLRLDMAPGGPATLEALLRLQQIARATAHAAGTYQDGFRILRAIVRAAGALVRDAPERILRCSFARTIRAKE